jgi:hypothetical protein
MWRRGAVRRIQAARRSALAFIARLPEAEVLRGRTIGRWSVKDVLAHLATCDEETVRRFRLIARGRADRIFWFESMADADRFNATETARLRRLGAAAICRRFDRAGSEVVAWLERLPADALGDPSHAYAVVDWLPVPGWDHVIDHLNEVKAWWRAEQRVVADRTAAERRARGERAARRRTRSRASRRGAPPRHVNRSGRGGRG